LTVAGPEVSPARTTSIVRLFCTFSSTTWWPSASRTVIGVAVKSAARPVAASPSTFVLAGLKR
jgi:hypothetical protein